MVNLFLSIQFKTLFNSLLHCSSSIRFTQEGWPCKTENVKLEKFQKLADSLTFLHRCLLYGTIMVISLYLQPQVLKIMLKDHFGIQKWSNSLEQQFIGLTWIRIFRIYASLVPLVQNIKIVLPNHQFTHRWHQRNIGVVFIRTMLLTLQVLTR